MKPHHRSIAGLATIILVAPVSADVIYSNLQNIAIPATYAGVYLDVDGGNGWNTDINSPVAGWDINPYFGGSYFANSPAFQPVRNGTGALDSILNLSFGGSVGGGSTFSTFTQGPGGQNPGGPGYGGSETHLGNSAGKFIAGTEGYLGFRLNGANYGWMRVVFTNNAGGAVIKDWSYDTSGAAISVGGIQQVGSDVILASGFTVSSAINNSGGPTNLLKNSVGANTLTAVNTYTGTTTVTSGTLAVNGTGSINSSSGVTINGGTFRYNSSVALTSPVTFTSGTLGGTNLTGSLGGLTIGTDQTLSPGNSPGTAATTSQTWAGGGTYLWEMNDAAGTAGVNPGWDFLTGSGDLNITATSGSKFTIDLTSLGLDDFAGDAVNFSDLSSYSWLIADFATVSNFAANAFSLDDTGFSNPHTGLFGIVRGDAPGITGGDSSQIYLTYRPVPEPQAALLSSLGLLALLRRRRS